ncbi:MAG TPA: Uma2 family endonuclease [Candidatus Binatia bacterium]|nr:Uma2 family endonuclease [Candidatus Binatia bacterium]
MATNRAVLTAEEFFAMPEDDDQLYELLDGELMMRPTPVPLHQRIVGNLFMLLRAYVREHGLGEVFLSPIAVVLSETSVVVPDLVYLAGDRAALVTARAIEGAPTLLIEVSSPSTRHLDRRRKLELYARHGVPYYWMVETDERAIEAYELADGAYRLARRGAGDAPVSLPPFGDLAFAPEALWRP